MPQIVTPESLHERASDGRINAFFFSVSAAYGSVLTLREGLDVIRGEGSVRRLALKGIATAAYAIGASNHHSMARNFDARGDALEKISTRQPSSWHQYSPLVVLTWTRTLRYAFFNWRQKWQKHQKKERNRLKRYVKRLRCRMRRRNDDCAV